MPSIQGVDLSYYNLNSYGVFCAGDTITGTVSFSVHNEANVESLFVKAKADGKIALSKGDGDSKRSYSTHKRYFKVKQYLIDHSSKVTVLRSGVHRFTFSINIPQMDMPSSFTGKHGKIVYLLEAKLSKSWGRPCVVKREFNFVARPILSHGQCSQIGLAEKYMGVFTKKQVKMAVFLDKKAYVPGQTVLAVAKIKNDSSKTLIPKFTLQQRIVYWTKSDFKKSKKTICKLSGQTIAACTKTTVTCPIVLPHDLPPSIQNCDMLSLDYCVKVYLDIALAFDPTVAFPVVIIPSIFAIDLLGEAAAPYPAGTVGSPGNSDIPRRANSDGSPAPWSSGVYGPIVPVSAQYPNMASGYNQLLPPQASPHGIAASSGHHLQPTAPSLPQPGEHPPSYKSLFPHS
ncbi:arrestin domain-containing protein 3-like [Thalassophryne amazonica]|uniref:arrestin domain-containing protein 3-like n=1 Tax=Thalassophryne amazonica TaxID=390379 RepID=UPI0014725E41|nr:arrestin domain-containing protein 3-like [Thalassophryne amazonica]